MNRNTENTFHFSFSKKQLWITFLGNLLIGVGIAILRVSAMGNDAYSAMTMSLSQITPFSLGTFQVLLNAVLMLVQLIWGKKYIGIGTVINMFLLGYIVQYSIPLVVWLIGEEGSHPFILQLLIMFVGLFIIALGIAIYQKANAGVAPFDYLSLGMTDAFPTPYFLNRMITDALCVIMALLPWALRTVAFTDCHIGLGTILCVSCLGPFVSLCDKWIVSKCLAQEKALR